MRLALSLAGLALLLASSGCEVERGYGGAYVGVGGEYPSYPVYSGPYAGPYVYGAPYDRDHYWDRRHYWERHRYHHRDWD